MMLLTTVAVPCDARTAFALAPDVVMSTLVALKSPETPAPLP